MNLRLASRAAPALGFAAISTACTQLDVSFPVGPIAFEVHGGEVLPHGPLALWTTVDVGAYSERIGGELGRVRNVDVRSGHYDVVSNDLNLNLPRIALAWQPESIEEPTADELRTRTLATVPEVQAGRTLGGDLELERPAARALGEHLVNPASQLHFNLFARTSFDLAPDAPDPTGTLRFEVSLEVRVTGDVSE